MADNSLSPPLRSAMKYPSSSRPSSPVPLASNGLPHVDSSASLDMFASSPHTSRVAFSPSQSPVQPSIVAPQPHAGSTPFARTTNSPGHAPSYSAMHVPGHPSPHQATTAGYTSKVSFDTFENPAASMFSFTLQVKSSGYARTRATRVFLCASSPDESGREALDWSLESLAQDGDELIVCRCVDLEDLEKDHEAVRDDARELMRQIQEKSVQDEPERKLSLILEYIPGKITETLDRLIALYRPDSVVVGTRGRKAWQGMGMGIGMGSISKYCLTHSPVPIIVVRPERKVKKAVDKRRADPKRGTHFDELARPRPSGSTRP